MDARHEEIARCLFRESNDALFIFDPRDHRVVDVNPAALRLTGFDKDVVCGLHLRDLFTSADPADLDRLVEAYRRTGFYHSREGYSLSREAGEPIPVNVSVSRIHTTPEPLGLVVARDVSERVRAQEALRESEARYRSLVESAQVIIGSVGSDGLIRSLNPVFVTLTGWPTAAWVGRSYRELVLPDDRPTADRALARALAGETVLPFELRVRSARGEPLVVEVLSATRQLVGGEPVVSAFARDVTARRRAADALRGAEAMRLAKESAEAADRAKREFLGHISHEIRTPLTTILGFTELLLDDPRVAALPADLLDGLGAIRRSGNHLLDLINDLLDLTRIEMGKLRVEPRPCAIARVVEAVAAAMRPRAEAKGLRFEVEVEPAVPETVETDEVRVRQILINLLGNALKFTAEGGVRLRVGVEPAAGAGRPPALRVDVADTGAGLTPAAFERLFEPFYTLDADHRAPHRESGAGLGLPISRRLAELLGGRITVESRPGAGSTFTLTLPIGPPSAAGAATDPRATGRGGPRAAGPVGRGPLGGRVLLAEDNEAIRHYVAIRLGQAGAEVAVADDGEEAVRIALEAEAEGRPFDWVLMDVQMPVLDGYEATRQLRDRGYTRPIVALTAYALPDDPEQGLRTGCDAHIGKPVDWDELTRVLQALRGTTHAPRADANPSPRA